MKKQNNLLTHLDKLHTTELGTMRIKRNLALNTEDIVEWCKAKISSPECVITIKGKNWYAQIDGVIITVNAYGYTIITAHREK
jgi:hypothetical protein